MKRINIYILLALFAMGENRLQAQQVNDSIFRPVTIQNFRLMDPVHQETNGITSIAADNKLLLFIFLSPDCPICKSYTPALNELRQQYFQTVKMIGIIPGRTYDNDSVKAFAQKYKIAFSILIDRKKQLSNYLHASITPEVVLLNSNAELVYRGAIDNSVTQLGGLKSTKHVDTYLEDAINKYLQHRSIAMKRVKAVGCRINDF